MLVHGSSWGCIMIMLVACGGISLIAIVLHIQLLWLFIQTVASLRADKAATQKNLRRDASVCVVIPAHNEAASILNTLSAISVQLSDADRLLVVADNCDDETGAIAAQQGAEVIERRDKSRVGKGYALDFAIKHLQAVGAPDVVIFIDADCVLAPGSIDELTRMCVARQRPTQANNLMFHSKSAGGRERIAEFAWKMRNYVRQLGAAKLRAPCQVTGTGMAFPWALIRGVNLATGHIVEDMKLGVDLIIAGYDPVFCPAAKVTSKFPSDEEGIKTQRTRWEHGHLMTILEHVPRLLTAAIQQQKITLLISAIDLSIPALGLMSLSVSVLALCGIALSFLGAPKIILGLSLGPSILLALSIIIAWRAHATDILFARDLLDIPHYALSKIPTLWEFAFKRQTAWVRSKRDMV